MAMARIEPSMKPSAEARIAAISTNCAATGGQNDPFVKGAGQRDCGSFARGLHGALLRPRCARQQPASGLQSLKPNCELAI